MKVGIIFGEFDLLHLGHLVMLEEAKRHCDHLIVGLKTDTQERDESSSHPAQTVVERFIKLEGCRYVDEIIPYGSDEELMDMLQSLPIDIRFVEGMPSHFPGKDYCLQEGIELYYTKRKHRFTSDRLRKVVTEKELTKEQLVKTIN
ncbi:adenylyltransferase/cytidyltransferase family protein [Sphingobacterium sp. SGR-19]|uniref:adenylyltransferase/cytidyltransferase family protein n=1 Tax=Sphingobacterium sp. SGR-19 TaxID=2710886 RepID=UPI0013EDE967|nr:adenylyltransferase/cytidyltransferase family protein [Sphingobacterium sp. SGR-19]NGM66932.1 adenylyltransferase/cytidyltransferase family protein [Sphingobacterium sp. SGR-19]